MAAYVAKLGSTTLAELACPAQRSALGIELAEFAAAPAEHSSLAELLRSKLWRRCRSPPTGLCCASCFFRVLEIIRESSLSAFAFSFRSLIFDSSLGGAVAAHPTLAHRVRALARAL